MNQLQRFVLAILTIGVIAVYCLFGLLLTAPIFGQVSEEKQEVVMEAATRELPSLSPPVPTLSLTSGMQSASASKPGTTPVPLNASKPGATPVPLNARIQPPVQFLGDYMQNSSYSNIVDAIPWANTSVNRWQYNQALGGVTLWDYFSSKAAQGYEEDWSSSRYGWLDEQGAWQIYRTERIRNSRGQEFVDYVIVDRLGTGVVDKMVFTHYSVDALPSDSNPDLAEWGYLSRLGRLRIEVDNKVAYDVPVEEWFSGKALCLSADLAKLFFLALW